MNEAPRCRDEIHLVCRALPVGGAPIYHESNGNITSVLDLGSAAMECKYPWVIVPYPADHIAADTETQYVDVLKSVMSAEIQNVEINFGFRTVRIGALDLHRRDTPGGPWYRGKFPQLEE